MSGPRPSPPAAVLLAVLAFYSRWISPALGPRCRFAPTCSSYAAQAVRRHGAARGSWLALRRIVRCHPFHPGGHDPVPPARRPRVSLPQLPPARLDAIPSRPVPARPDAPEQTRA